MKIPDMVRTRMSRLAVAITSVVTFAVSAPPAALAQQSDAPVVIWVGSWWAPQVPVWQALWEADYPEIELDFQPLPINGYLDKFTSSAIGGNPPDVIDLDATWVSTVAAQGLLQPLTDVAEQISVEDISPAIWAAGNYDGVPYAIPNRSSTEVWYYNKTVFDKAGVEYPTPDWTHDDLVEIAQKLTISGEQFGIGLPADPSDPSNVLTVLAPTLWHFGGDFLNEDRTAAAINTPESVMAITYWSDFYLKYKASPEGTPNFSTSRDLFPLFEANKLGLLASSSNTIAALLERPEVKWGVITAPDKVNRAGGWTMGVPVGASNTEGAKTFLKWMSQPEIMAKGMNRTPANLKSRQMEPWNDPQYQVFTDAEPDARPVPAVAGWFQIQDTVIVELQKLLIGQMTPQEAADSAAAKINRILAEHN